MRFLASVCALFFVIGGLSILLGTVNELFDLGIWPHNGYPILANDRHGNQQLGSYGTFLWRFALITAVAGLLGTFLFNRSR